MFIFYYAVLSEVSPPTALSPLAAAALTGGNPFRTMMLTWKYTLPAFLVPFVFTLRSEGIGILMQGSAGAILWTSATAAVGVCAIAVAAGGRVKQDATIAERGMAAVAGLLLMYPAVRSDVAGLSAVAAVVAAHLWRTRTFRPASPRATAPAPSGPRDRRS
jgi:TRAP-type uncharacterized transport system fused permease subunit